MSIRTIIEINHDYLNALISDSELMRDFLLDLRSASIQDQLEYYKARGITFLNQRHHSDDLPDLRRESK